MKVPYATCDFAAIRAEGYFYIDKTPYLAKLENINEKHLIFLRPRRFGKSTLISLLENYYDVRFRDVFDTRFGGLWIHQHPTPLRHKYLVLTIDLSPVDTVGDIKAICKSFATQVKGAVQDFIARYSGLVPELAELMVVAKSSEEDMAGLMTNVLKRVGRANQQMYLLIDEYDHFGNRLLSDDRKTTYDELVKASGFVRSFYASIKAFTRESVIARTFITGVSPIMLDDLSSGFNIIKHISQHSEFNALAGFTQTDVELAIDTLLHDMPELRQDPEVGDRELLLATLARYYNGYRFSPDATEKLYNSTLVLHFLSELASSKHFPRKMLDLNVRTDYGRLYQIAKSTSEKDRDTRDLLEEVLTNESIDVQLVEQFGTKFHMGRAQVASLFFYMGMLTFAEDVPLGDVSKLVIPNLVMRKLQWEYMSFALMEHDDIQLNMGALQTATLKMARHGEIQPLLDLFHDNVVKKMGLRETLTFNEQTMKLMLVSYLSQCGAFFMKTEPEMSQGFCDLLLGVRGPNGSGKYAWIIEAKYLKTNATQSRIHAVVDEGYAQIDKYASNDDIVAMLTETRELKGGVLVFLGLKDVQYFPWPRPANVDRKKALRAGGANHKRKK